VNILNTNYLQSQQSQGQGQQLLNYLSIFRKVKILSNHINTNLTVSYYLATEITHAKVFFFFWHGGVISKIN
jgi:hypothetical protein